MTAKKTREYLFCEESVLFFFVFFFINARNNFRLHSGGDRTITFFKIFRDFLANLKRARVGVTIARVVTSDDAHGARIPPRACAVKRCVISLLFFSFSAYDIDTRRQGADERYFRTATTTVY